MQHSLCRTTCVQYSWVFPATFLMATHPAFPALLAVVLVGLALCAGNANVSDAIYLGFVARTLCEGARWAVTKQSRQCFSALQYSSPTAYVVRLQRSCLRVHRQEDKGAGKLVARLGDGM